jgi:hypothetical protein
MIQRNVLWNYLFVKRTMALKIAMYVDLNPHPAAAEGAAAIVLSSAAAASFVPASV